MQTDTIILGCYSKDQGKLDEAIEAYNKALSLKPDYAEAYIQHGHRSPRARQV